ncbi:MAG: beta-glucosidase, partial [Tidjanibacter sp.]|nr:beta-glucosidase [Tidjanibacter sp.]
MKRLLTLALSLTLLAGCTQSDKELKLNEKNIKKIVAAMTLDEKATLVIGGGNTVFTGIGNTMKIVPGAAGSSAQIERLGIAPTVVADGPAGLRISPTREGTEQTYYCTGFPIATALACSWDMNLLYEIGEVMGNEVAEYGVDVLLAPGMNLHRDPLCGRNFEYYS